MQTITALVPQKRNRKRVNLFLDDQFALGLTATVAAELNVGQQLSPEEIALLQEAETIEKAKQSAYRYISYRPRSTQELEQNLRKKGYETAVIEQVVAHLIKLDLLDDTAFATYWIEQRETFKPRSQFALSQELRQKGISRAIIEEAVAQVDDQAMARKAAEMKFSRWSHLSEEDFRLKMGRYLQRRGFPYAIIKTVTTELWSTVSDEPNMTNSPSKRRQQK